MMNATLFGSEMESDSDFEEHGFGGVGIIDEVLSEDYWHASRDVVGFSD